jgi:hypothetical protein
MEFVQHTCLYRIICRKKSKRIGFAEEGVVYWMPNMAGYTTSRSEAGLYTALQLDECGGNGFDWLAERLSHQEMREL